MATKHHQQLEAHLGSLALKRGVQPRHVESALSLYKKHLRTLSDDEIARLSGDDDALDEHAGAFFEGCSETAPQPEDDPGAASPSSSGTRSSSSTGGSSSMNRESRETLKRRGISWS